MRRDSAMMRRIGQRAGDDAGFTLIELLIVVIILGVLAGVAVFSVQGLGDDGRRAAEQTDAQTLSRAQEAYFAKYGRYATEDELVAAGFLTEPSTLHDIDLLDGRYAIVAAAARALPLEQQVLTVGVRGDDAMVSTIDRNRIGLFPLYTNAVETLVRMSNDFAVVPGLAERWEFVAPNTWRFHLRRNVTFHDGSPFTAADVKYTLDRTVTLKTAGTGNLGPSSTVVVDDHTVDVTPTVNNRRLPDALTHPMYGILRNGSKPEDNPPEVIGTGPFTFEEWVPNQHIIVRRYPGYWGEKARLNQITFRFIGDSSTRRLALESGDIDVMMDLPRADVPAIRQRRGLTIAAARPGYTFIMAMNMHANEPVQGVSYDLLQDIRVRRALALSLDRERIVTQVYSNRLAEVVQTVNPPALYGRHAPLVKGFTRNTAEAVQLLEAAGFTEIGADGVRVRPADGRRLSLLILTGVIGQSSAPDDEDTAALQLLTAQAKEVGIELKLRQVVGYLAELQEGRFDIYAWGPNQNDANPGFLMANQWYCVQGGNPCQVSSPSPARNWIRPQTPAFDALFAEVLARPNDSEARLYAARAMSELVDNQSAVIPVAGLSRIWGLREGVEGLEPAHPARAHQPWSRVFRTR